MTAPRFVQDDTAVLDTETGMRAPFSDTRTAADAEAWMNSGNATITDYEWVAS